MERVRMVFTKWGGRPHWEYDTVSLGSDHHGLWLGLPRGSLVRRPGAEVVTGEDQVVLVPDAGWVATFYSDDGPAPCAVYVDISTSPIVEGAVVRAVDLDLDVLRGRTGRVWVDDEDEFADHRVRYAYPPGIVQAATSACEWVRDRVQSSTPPFDGVTARRWLERLGQVDGLVPQTTEGDDHAD